MKLSIILMVVFTLNLSATGFAQFSFTSEGKKVREVLDIIEKESNYRFFYNDEFEFANNVVDLKFINYNINQVLDKLLAETDYTYSIFENNLIVISLKDNIRELSDLQQNIVKGTITDENGKPITGATIVVKGTTRGTTTDLNGNYILADVTPQTTLVVSFIGYQNQEILVGNKSQINVAMQQEVTALDEVVVIGYGTSSRRAVTGSISKVSTENITKKTISSITTALTGQVAGVQVSRGDIRIRGVSSLYAGSDPLLVVDGVTAGLSLSQINPYDIESIEILKDASAGAIYGSRAANGVIIVTTKSGKKGESTFNFEASGGFDRIYKWFPIANGPELISVLDRAWQNSLPSRAGQKFTNFPLNGLDGYNRAMAEATNTDWRDYVMQPSYFHQYNLTTTGGSDKTRFFLSGQYRYSQGSSAGGYNNRSLFRANLDHDVAKWLSVGTKLNTVFDYSYGSWGGGYYSLLPIYPVMSPSTDPLRQGRYFYDRDLAGFQGNNPLYRGEETWSDSKTMRTVNSVYADLKPVKGLVIRSEWGLRFSASRSRSYQSREYWRKGEGGVDITQEGGISYSRSEVYHYTGTNTISYDNTFGNHSFNLMIGNSIENYDNNGQGNTYQGFPTDYFTLTNANTNLVQTRQSVSVDQYRFISYIGRARYNYKNRYFAEANYRADYSSRFGKDNRWGYFPGFAFSWIISEEQFLKSLSLINYAKIRFSRGNVGNGEVGNYPYLSSVVAWPNYGGQPGLLFANIGNNSIHWEKQLQTNLGVDFSILKDRISVSFDLFNKNVTDLIVKSTIGCFQGYYITDIIQNLGGMKNKGFDFSITTDNLVGQLKWTSTFNISRARSIVTKLSPDQRYIISGNNIVVEGQQLGAYYLPIYAGVDPATGHELVYVVDPGKAATYKPMVSDLTGEVMDLERLSRSNKYSVILTDKSPYPDVYGGFVNTFSYKGFELSATINYQIGNYLYCSGYQGMMYISSVKNVSRDLLNGWTKENPTNVPLIYGTHANVPTTRFLYDGTFARLKTLQISYMLPQKIIGKTRILSNVIIKAGGDNLLTLTMKDFPGDDPEVGGGSGLSGNISPGSVGIGDKIRSYYFAINISF